MLRECDWRAVAEPVRFELPPARRAEERRWSQRRRRSDQLARRRRKRLLEAAWRRAEQIAAERSGGGQRHPERSRGRRRAKRPGGLGAEGPGLGAEADLHRPGPDGGVSARTVDAASSGRGAARHPACAERSAITTVGPAVPSQPERAMHAWKGGGWWQEPRPQPSAPPELCCGALPRARRVPRDERAPRLFGAGSPDSPHGVRRPGMHLLGRRVRCGIPGNAAGLNAGGQTALACAHRLLLSGPPLRSLTPVSSRNGAP